MAGKNAQINASYTTIKFGFSENYKFDFSANLTYASLKGADSVTITNAPANSRNSAQAYTGFCQKENSGNTVTIASNYGSVTFFKN